MTPQNATGPEVLGVFALHAQTLVAQALTPMVPSGPAVSFADYVTAAAQAAGFASPEERTAVRQRLVALGARLLVQMIGEQRAPLEWWELEHQVRLAFIAQHEVPGPRVVRTGDLALIAEAVDEVWAAYLATLAVPRPADRLRTVAVPVQRELALTTPDPDRAAADAAHRIAEVQAA